MRVHVHPKRFPNAYKVDWKVGGLESLLLLLLPLTGSPDFHSTVPAFRSAASEKLSHKVRLCAPGSHCACSSGLCCHKQTSWRAGSAHGGQHPRIVHGLHRTGTFAAWLIRGILQGLKRHQAATRRVCSIHSRQCRQTSVMVTGYRRVFPTAEHASPGHLHRGPRGAGPQARICGSLQ